MKFKIVHDTPGRIRLRCGGYYFDKNQEKSLEKTILSEQYVESVKAKSVNYLSIRLQTGAFELHKRNQAKSISGC